MKNTRQYFQEIYFLLGADRRKTPWLLFLFLVNSLIEMVGLGLVGTYITYVINSESIGGGYVSSLLDYFNLPPGYKTRLTLIGLVLILVFLIKSIMAIWIHYTITVFGAQLRVRLTNYLMHSYQHLPYTEYLCRNSSEYIHSINNLTNQFSGVVKTLLHASSQVILCLMLLGFLAWTNGPALILLIALLGGMVFSYDRLFRRKTQELGQKSNLALIKMVQGINEGIEGLKEIRILHVEDYFHKQVKRKIGEYSKFSVILKVISIAPSYILELMLTLFIVIFAVATLYQGQDLVYLIPDLGIFGLASLRLKPATNIISSTINTLRQNRDSIRRLNSDLINLEQINKKPKIEKFSKLPAEAYFKSLELKHVCFSYPNVGFNALNDVTLKICKGESVGLIGTSGSGKTTLIDLILGLLVPQEGKILYNGLNMGESLAQWRSQVAYLPQEVFLIDNTLRHNVALGVNEKDIDEKRLYKALRQARLQDQIQNLPMGIDTILGERGVRLSGGQRQRVALARAFYHERSVIVLDEATSALDNETELEIIDEINHLKGKKTLIVIAHRLTTVKQCDRILRVEKGEIAEQGTFDEVINSKKNYTAELAKN